MSLLMNVCSYDNHSHMKVFNVYDLKIDRNEARSSFTLLHITPNLSDFNHTDQKH